MLPNEFRVVPVIHDGLVLTGGAPDMEQIDVLIDGVAQDPDAVAPDNRYLLIAPPPAAEYELDLRDAETNTSLPGAPLTIRSGLWKGDVHTLKDTLVYGFAEHLETPDTPVALVAYSDGKIIAFATTNPDAGGEFCLSLPRDIVDGETQHTIHIGVAGSDYLLRNGSFTPRRHHRLSTPRILQLPLEERTIRLKISTPNMKEAPMWGDYHFAVSLKQSLERLGQRTNIDTLDNWYDFAGDQDVTITLRGRQQYKPDPNNTNIMWLISHPDRIPPEEYAAFDHIAVASDIYAAQLKLEGLKHVSALHQATDATLFIADSEIPRKPACLFVGNSRREYRTMVQWCIQRDIPLDLYGGGWEGVVDPALVKGTNIANTDLPQYYASHLILLNDHWDSMRENGFISNRMFDGSAVGTPILSDPVQGLAEVFGDSISTAESPETFERLIKDCLENPTPYLQRAETARNIVLEAHTFDHRARQLSALIDRYAVV